ncbi:hypothetical protein A3C89_03675 [Candidatus Kaiserbacteria bacterium RIFCSPHIGHO2_02_FULL_50_50]|uniref:Peptidase S24/S26A/S26B/S26C domain-containing protein n=1 Tax=Candidatus Kaiserbacteria bacterium RIFCSPHIGHO2_02_FULL_50_50 TaxID=1798492 RepID=A0A1F6DBY8_9BACT|nr:MAG: hypothetical protein A3C89_03675 [Candidatus Kaiserbacteria bacterium RIFCSPHIGHO2_02_FULL_50_50]OGG88560.1 MAG: hypothetical protein A3G62_03570 [Candidatus Kaiserbacteria bacterium RIFCSPLOWO2_12_FULL_50_10]
MAGFGSPIDDGRDVGSLEAWLLADPDATYLISMDGDALLDAQIAPGDFLLTQRTRTVRAGDIVVAEIDGDYVVRFLRKNGRGEQYLEAANDAYPKLVPQESLNIEGKVIACIRKYGSE